MPNHCALVGILFLFHGLALAQATPPEPQAGTSTDLFTMFGSDFVRPGLEPKANYNIGLGHTFAFLKKDPFGDELTFGYTYENGGSHGFCTRRSDRTPKPWGLWLNFALPKDQTSLTGYTCGFRPVQHHQHDRQSICGESFL